MGYSTADFQGATQDAVKVCGMTEKPAEVDRLLNKTVTVDVTVEQDSEAAVTSIRFQSTVDCCCVYRKKLVYTDHNYQELSRTFRDPCEHRRILGPIQLLSVKYWNIRVFVLVTINLTRFADRFFARDYRGRRLIH
jgi:hypothetical protein